MTAGRAAVLAPRLPVPDEFGLTRYLAAGVAVPAVVDKAVRVDIGASGRRTGRRGAAQQRGARTVHQSRQESGRAAGRPARSCWPATVRRRWPWPSTARRRCCAAARQVVAAVGLTDALGALSPLNIAPVDYETALFHDEELDGPLPSRGTHRGADLR